MGQTLRGDYMDLVTLAIAKKYTRDQIAEAAVGGIDIEEYVGEKIDAVLGGASEEFDTLKELAEKKVDKVSGKGLSTNDFTNAYKTKLDSALTSYTETDPTVPAWAKAETKPTYTASDVGAVPTTRTVNNKALSANISLTASDVNAVPTTRTVNGKALSGNITLSATDVNALPSDTALFSGNYNDLTNKPTIPSISGLATETYVDNAVANIILTSEGGKKFKLSVDDSGTLTAVEVTE